MPPIERDPPSPFAVAHLARLRSAVRRGWCADLAAGRGRHALWLAAQGARVVAIDRNARALAELRGAIEHTASGPGRIETVRGDIEDPRGLALVPGCVSLLVITRFLHREGCAAYAELLEPGGVLFYETFLARQRELGRGPKRAAFLLEDDELPTLFSELEVLARSEGLRETPQREWVASLLARKPGGDGAQDAFSEIQTKRLRSRAAPSPTGRALR